MTKEKIIEIRGNAQRQYYILRQENVPHFMALALVIDYVIASVANSDASDDGFISELLIELLE